MSDQQEVDAQAVIASLQGQIAEQALRIALLEARVVGQRAASNGQLINTQQGD